LHQLDQNVTADHLTSLYVEKLGSPIANEVVDLVLLARTLREKCPWDKEQTHHSLGRYLIEESYELLDAIEELTNALKESDTKDAFSVAVTHLEEELGDVLFQVVFHSTLGAEEGYFTLADVARSVTEKLIERHPHVFSDAIRSDADDVARQWETLKKAQKGRTSVLEGIPAALPALSLSATILRKGRGLIATATQESGEKRRALLEKIEAATFTKGSPSVLSEDEAGALLWGLVALIGRAGLDPEGVLRHYAQLMIAKVRSLEMPYPGT
jgi:MazG family protein